MKVVTASQMRQIDRDTIEGIGIPGIVLMETAGTEIVRVIKQFYPSAETIGIFIGKGNNGGDGLVIARQLAHYGHDVFIFLVTSAESLSAEAHINLNIAKKLGLHIEEILTEEELKEANPRYASCDLLVDAIFGTGLKGTVRKPVASIINTINELPIPVLSVDLPSGLDANTGQVLGTCIKADKTITIGLPKRGLLLHPGAELTSELDIVDIGFPQQVIDAQHITVNMATAALAAEWIPYRHPASHKGSHGRVLVVAGSLGMSGAAALTSEAALRVGAGLVTLAIPESLNSIMEVKLSEVMTLPLPETEVGSLNLSAVAPILDYVEKTGSILVVGPGLSQHPETVTCVKQLISEVQKNEHTCRMVIDADGLNALAQHRDSISKLGSGSVVTPHPGEMSRLTGHTIQTLESDRIRAAEEFVKEYKLTLVFKGAPTITAYPNGDIWINSTGNHGMATAGMGDVLTGVIAGLMAQNLKSETAATLGVYIHGFAGDIAAQKIGTHGLIAGDVLQSIPNAIAKHA